MIETGEKMEIVTERERVLGVKIEREREMLIDVETIEKKKEDTERKIEIIAMKEMTAIEIEGEANIEIETETEVIVEKETGIEEGIGSVLMMRGEEVEAGAEAQDEGVGAKAAVPDEEIMVQAKVLPHVVTKKPQRKPKKQKRKTLKGILSEGKQTTPRRHQVIQKASIVWMILMSLR